jgi:hypothetical protein
VKKVLIVFYSYQTLLLFLILTLIQRLRLLRIQLKLHMLVVLNVQR